MNKEFRSLEMGVEQLLKKHCFVNGTVRDQTLNTPFQGERSSARL